jgi:hypothetical protein
MNNGMRAFGIGLLIVALGQIASEAKASVVVYSATDVGAGLGSPTPNASAAAASFATAAAAIANVSTVNFESAPVGSFTNLGIAPGVSMNGTNLYGNPMPILNTPNYPADSALDGFNTTPGGSNYVEMEGGSLVFTFAQPTQFFGAFFTGVQSFFFQDTITFTDSNGLQVVSIFNPNTTNGGVTFVGFTDAGESITSVTITSGSIGTSQNPGYGDFIGVDDVSFQAVPEPSTLTLASMAVVGGLVQVMTARKRQLKSVC